MSKSEADQLELKITEGVKLAIKRLIERTKKEDGELVVFRDGKIVRVKARDIKIS
jgi:signal peptidase I